MCPVSFKCWSSLPAYFPSYLHPSPISASLSSPIPWFLNRMHGKKSHFKLKRGNRRYIFSVTGFKLSVWIQHIYKSLAELSLGFSLTFCLVFSWAQKLYNKSHRSLMLNKQNNWWISLSMHPKMSCLTFQFPGMIHSPHILCISN